MSCLVSLQNVGRNFPKGDGKTLSALHDISFTIEDSHHLISLIGPDGAGKTTLLRILAGLDQADVGNVRFDPGAEHNLNIGYMSQKLGLYSDISVFENLKLFSCLRDLTTESEEQALAYLKELLIKVNLWQFRDRQAGSLSGGMKQKLALTCALSSKPQLLILDEPTVGVDPISRRELWDIILSYIKEHNCYCIFSSLYLEEADRGDLTLFINNGSLLYVGDVTTLKTDVAQRCFSLITKAEDTHKVSRALMFFTTKLQHIIDICPRLGRIDILAQKGASLEDIRSDINKLFSELKWTLTYTLQKREPVLEDAYISRTYTKERQALQQQSSLTDFNYTTSEEVVINVTNIKKVFGAFTAVHDSSFQVHKGEIFGLLGPNGAGKTTTFRMICALLKPSAGTVLINNMSLRKAKSSVRATIGYVAQKFCLYRKMTLLQNLRYFGMSYGLKGELLEERLKTLITTLHLEKYIHELSDTLPFGIQRSLSMACALIHRPSILFLDEATSGADPTSRREFWRLITTLASSGTTIIVTTHFMEEAEYCDRFLIQDQGKILVLGSPNELCLKKGKRVSIEEVFISEVEKQH